MPQPVAPKPRRPSRDPRDVIAVRVLIIEDDPELCRKLAGWLRDERFLVSAFGDAEAGLAAAAEGFDVALVDLRLPDTDGVEVVGRLRERGRAARVLALCAFPDDHLLAAAARAGASEVLSKPLQPPAVLRALDREIARLGLPPRRESDFNRGLGARLRALRSQAGLTQQELAQRCGVTAAQLSQIELGKTATSTWTLARLCAALRVPLTRVFEES
jgi:DNA-binding response OmpR family regulator